MTFLQTTPTFEPDPRMRYSWQERMDAVALYMLVGNMRIVSEKKNISYDTLLEWKKSDWWPEMVDQLRRQKKSKTADGLTNIVEQSLDVIKDRLENGDFVLNNKTGQIVRKPVGVKDAANIANNLLHRQMQLEEVVERSATTQDTVQETLSLLAKEFQKLHRMEKKNNAETIEFKES